MTTLCKKGVDLIVNARDQPNTQGVFLTPQGEAQYLRLKNKAKTLDNGTSKVGFATKVVDIFPGNVPVTAIEFWLTKKIPNELGGSKNLHFNHIVKCG